MKDQICLLENSIFSVQKETSEDRGELREIVRKLLD